MYDAEISTTDLMARTGVSHRTLFYWVREDLLPRPRKQSLGRGRGVLGFWPQGVVPRVKLLLATRHFPLSEKRRVLRGMEYLKLHTPEGSKEVAVTPVIAEESRSDRHYQYRLTEDGDVLLTTKRRREK